MPEMAHKMKRNESTSVKMSGHYISQHDETQC